MRWLFCLVSICILPFVQLLLVQASTPLPWNTEDGELWMDHIMNTKLRWFSAVTLVIMDLVLLLLNAFLMGLGVGELKDRTAKVCLACSRRSFWGVNFLNYFFFKTQPIQWLEWLILFVCMSAPLRHVAQPTFRILSSRVPGLQVWIIKTSETTPLVYVEFLSECSEYVL